MLTGAEPAGAEWFITHRFVAAFGFVLVVELARCSAKWRLFVGRRRCGLSFRSSLLLNWWKSVLFLHLLWAAGRMWFASLLGCIKAPGSSFCAILRVRTRNKKVYVYIYIYIYIYTFIIF